MKPDRTEPCGVPSSSDCLIGSSIGNIRVLNSNGTFCYSFCYLWWDTRYILVLQWEWDVTKTVLKFDLRIIENM